MAFFLALVHGTVKDDRGVIKVDVGRLPWNRERFGTAPDSSRHSLGEPGESWREAETEYKVIKRLNYKVTEWERRKHPGKDFGYTLLELNPKTGRTHQIRVHLKSIGHPVVADEFYAGRKTAREDRKWCPRLFLHAGEIEFRHPITNEGMRLKTELPRDLDAALEQTQRS